MITANKPYDWASETPARPCQPAGTRDTPRAGGCVSQYPVSFHRRGYVAVGGGRSGQALVAGSGGSAGSPGAVCACSAGLGLQEPSGGHIVYAHQVASAVEIVASVASAAGCHR